VNNAEAYKIMACMDCGKPGAQTYRLRDGRLVRVCRLCLHAWDEWMSGAVEVDASYGACRAAVDRARAALNGR